MHLFWTVAHCVSLTTFGESPVHWRSLVTNKLLMTFSLQQEEITG